MPSKKYKFQIGILGPAAAVEYPRGGGATASMKKLAYEVAFKLAQKKAVIITGGKSGVMEAAARGAKAGGSLTVGVTKGVKRKTSNPFTDIEILSGMTADGFDEFLLVNMCDGLVVIGGGAGTLEEIAIAYRNKKPIVALTVGEGWGDRLANTYLDSRKFQKIYPVANSDQAVKKILSLLHHRPSS